MPELPVQVDFASFSSLREYSSMLIYGVLSSRLEMQRRCGAYRYRSPWPPIRIRVRLHGHLFGPFAQTTLSRCLAVLLCPLRPNVRWGRDGERWLGIWMFTALYRVPRGAGVQASGPSRQSERTVPMISPPLSCLLLASLHDPRSGCVQMLSLFDNDSRLLPMSVSSL